MLVIYEAVEGMTKTAKGAIRLPYDDLSAYDAFEVLAPGLLSPLSVLENLAGKK